MKKISIVSKTAPQSYITVSDEDFSKVKNLRLEAVKSGERFYVRTKIKDHYVNIGRLIKGLSSNNGINVRYKDGNPFNNTRNNLIVE